MPIPQHIFDPPFNVIRSSHAVLDVTDLKASTAFYENIIGLHVEDSGPGFAPAVLRHALDAFFTTKPEGQGTGLGLSIAHAICREHGGRLLVGNGESGGGLVTLVLRRAQPEAQLIPFPGRDA